MQSPFTLWIKRFHWLHVFEISCSMWTHTFTAIHLIPVTVLLNYVTDYLGRSDTWTLLWGEKKKCGKYDRNSKEANTAGPHHCIGKGTRQRHGKTRKAKRVEESKGEVRELWVVEWKESRLVKKREDWYENICDGFRGKSARWARSTCCSPFRSLLFPLSVPVPHLSYLFMTDRLQIVMHRTSSQKPHTRFDSLLQHCKTHVTIMNIMTRCAALAHRLWQSASAFLFFSLWCSRQQGCVPTRQTEGQRLP